MSPFSWCGVSPPVLLSMLGTRSITRKICTAAALAAATASPYVADCPIPIPPCRTPKTQTTVEPGEKRKQEADPGQTPLTPTAKHKSRLGQFTLKRKKSKSELEAEDCLVCPLSPAPAHK